MAQRLACRANPRCGLGGKSVVVEHREEDGAMGLPELLIGLGILLAMVAAAAVVVSGAIRRKQ